MNKTQYDICRDMGMLPCTCGSDLVYAAQTGTAERRRPDSSSYQVPVFKGSCTECGVETTKTLGKGFAIDVWNKETAKHERV